MNSILDNSLVALALIVSAGYAASSLGPRSVRRRLLAEMRCATVEQVLARADDGLPKLWLIRQALNLRQRRPQLFGRDGDYKALRARGTRAAHAIAFSRGDGAIAIAPRLPLTLGGDWAGTTIALPHGGWRNELTGDIVDGGDVPLANLLSRFPVGLLSREELAT